MTMMSPPQTLAMPHCLVDTERAFARQGMHAGAAHRRHCGLCSLYMNTEAGQSSAYRPPAAFMISSAQQLLSSSTHSSEGEGVGPGVSSERVPPAAAGGVLLPCLPAAAAGVLGGCLAAAGVACWSGLLPAASDASAAAPLPSPACNTSMLVMIMVLPAARALTA